MKSILCLSELGFDKTNCDVRSGVENWVTRLIFGLWNECKACFDVTCNGVISKRPLNLTRES